MSDKSHLVFWEMVLILASVAVFRSVWLLLDTIEWLSRPAGLWASSGRWHDRRHRGACGREPGFVQMKETLL